MRLSQSGTLRQPTGSATAGITFGSSTTELVQITPLSSSAAFEQYGVETDRPYLVITAASGASRWVMHAKFTYDGADYIVVKPAETFNVFRTASHCSVVLNRA